MISGYNIFIGSDDSTLLKGIVINILTGGSLSAYLFCFPQTLRVQSSEGTARVEMLDTEVTSRLYERVHDTLNLNSFGFALHKDRARKQEISSSKSRQLREYGLQHGDMLYLSPVNGTVLFDQPSTSSEVGHDTLQYTLL